MTCKAPLYCERRSICITRIGLLHLAEHTGVYGTESAREYAYKVLNNDSTRLGCMNTRLTGLEDELNEDILRSSFGLGAFIGVSSVGTQEGDLS